MKKKKKKSTGKITVENYIKAIKKVDREIELSQSVGWTRVTSVHKCKKTYNRKADKKDYLNEQ